MTSSKILSVSVFCAALICLASVSQADSAHESESQTRDRTDLSENEPQVAEVVPKENPFDISQYNLEVTMENHEDKPVRVLQEMVIPNGVEVKSYTLESSFTNATRTRRTAGQERFTQSTGGLVNILPGHRTTAELDYVNHPALMLTPTTKKFHKMAANIKVMSDGLVGGEISTPNYPNNYPNGADITWVISYPPNNKIRFEMLYFSMEECCDHLTIYEGTNKSHSVLATFDGDFYPGSSNVVISSQPAIFLRFTSDCLVSGAGFRASYINQPEYSPPVTTPSPMSCGYVHVYSGNSGYVTSPGYDEGYYYESNMNCTWSVQTYYGTRVRFTIDHFHLNYNDYLYFYDGTPSYPGRLLTVLSGSVYSGYTVTADSNRAFLMFYSSSSNHGFDINYEGISAPTTTTVPPRDETSAVYYNPDQCGGVSYVNNYNDIVSPGYYSPGWYPPYESCQWRIQVYSGYVVSLQVHYFYTEYYDDWVYVYNGYSTSSWDRIASLSGYINSHTTVAIANTNQATVTFNSDCCYDYRGFQIHVTYTYRTPTTTESPPNDITTGYDEKCTTVYEAGYSGYVSSPNYSYYYDSNLNCSYFIQTPYGTSVGLYLQSFSLNSGDYLRIYNGRTGSLIRTLSGYYGYNYYIDTYTDYIQMVFTTDSYYSSSGFYIRYDAEYDDYYTTASPRQDCDNDTMPYNYGTITSPGYGYPQYSYTNNLDCVWTVQVYSYMYVLFTINYFDTENGYDYVTFYKGTPQNSQGSIWSCSGYVSGGTEILVRDNDAYVIFHTDSSVTERGFSISYSPVSQDFTTNSTTESSTPGYEESTGYRDRQYEVGRVGSPKIIGRDLWEGAKNRPPRRKKENEEEKKP